MLNITNHQRNANQNHSEISSHTCQNGCDQNTSVGDDVEERKCCWYKCKLVQPWWKTVWSFLKKLKMEFTCDPAIPHLGFCLSKGKGNTNSTSLFTSSCALQHYLQYQHMETTYISINGWMNKEMWCMYSMEDYLAMKKEIIMPVATV